MEAAAVVDLNLSRAEFWSMTPREFAACFQRHSEREYRADRRFAFLASYIANYAGRALPDHKTISPDDILGVRAAPQDSFVERLKRELDPAQAAERYIQQLRLADPDAHVTMVKPCSTVWRAVAALGRSSAPARDSLRLPACRL